MSKLRRQLMMASISEPVPPGPILPYDAEVEWLESTGSQYIDLGFKATNNIQFDISFYRPSNNVRFDCGAEDGWASKIVRCLMIENDHTYWRNHINKPSGSTLESTNYVGNIQVLANGRTATFTNLTSGESGTLSNNASSSFVTSGNFVLFGVSVISEIDVSATSSGLRFLSARITDADVELDLIPVRVGQVGYLYDRASGRLFGNSGTDNFILGNDKN